MAKNNSEKSLSVLLVEDSPSDANLLLESIRLSGSDGILVHVAASLKESSEYFRNNNIDATLLDLSLPDSNGLETIERIRSVSPAMPIVVLTGLEDETTGIEALRRGAQDYLVKGQATDGRLIIRAIRYAIERKKNQDELRKAHDELEIRVQERTAELAAEIAEREKARLLIRFTNTLLEPFVLKTSRKEYLDAVVKTVKDWSGCRCVGIRVTNEAGYIPYESCVGFSEEFLSLENMISLKTDNCVCIRTIIWSPEKTDMPFVTRKGSFRCDNTFDFLNGLTETEKMLYRGNCIKFGFASVAAIPIRYREQIVGAIHLADEAENKVPLEKVGFLEDMAALIGEAIHRFNVEESLRSSEKRLLEAQRLAHLGNWEWDISQKTLWWSDEVYRIFGLEPRQFGATYDAFLKYVHPDDRKLVEESVSLALREGGEYSIDHRVIRPDGSERIVHEMAEVTYDENGRPIKMTGTVYDITEQKKAENEIRANQQALIDLTAELQLVEERERRQIAQDLHDSLGQILAFLLMKIGILRKTCGKKMSEALEDVSNQLNEAVKQARTLSFDLSPSALYDLGFEVAVEDLVEKMAAERKINCVFENSAAPKPLADDVKILLYRSVRELLINAAKHAQASTIKVSLMRSSSDIYIKVEDNGQGFDTSTMENSSQKKKGFGIFSIRERLRHIGGCLKIESAQGKGTKMILIAPLKIDSGDK